MQYQARGCGHSKVKRATERENLALLLVFGHVEHSSGAVRTAWDIHCICRLLKGQAQDDVWTTAVSGSSQQLTPRNEHLEPSGVRSTTWDGPLMWMLPLHTCKTWCRERKISIICGWTGFPTHNQWQSVKVRVSIWHMLLTVVNRVNPS